MIVVVHPLTFMTCTPSRSNGIKQNCEIFHSVFASQSVFNVIYFVLDPVGTPPACLKGP